MEKEIEQIESYRTSSVFKCRDCGKEFESLKSARRLALVHSVKMKHRVSGEIVTAYHYNFK